MVLTNQGSESRELYRWQLDALVSWLRCGRRGVIEARAAVYAWRAGVLGTDPPKRAVAILRAMSRLGQLGSALTIAALRHGDRAGLLDELRTEEIGAYRSLIDALEKRAALLDVLARHLGVRRPFVRVGETVAEGQTLLIIEAMKTMNPIPAPRAGRILEMLVADGQPVEFGEPLAVIG